jgi:hypothetical protein
MAGSDLRSASLCSFTCRCDGRGSYVGPNHLTRWANKIGREERHVPCTAANIQHTHSPRQACSLKVLIRRGSKKLRLTIQAFKFENRMAQYVGWVFHGFSRWVATLE